LSCNCPCRRYCCRRRCAPRASCGLPQSGALPSGAIIIASTWTRTPRRSRAPRTKRPAKLRAPRTLRWQPWWWTGLRCLLLSRSPSSHQPLLARNSSAAQARKAFLLRALALSGRGALGTRTWRGYVVHIPYAPIPVPCRSMTPRTSFFQAKSKTSGG